MATLQTPRPARKRQPRPALLDNREALPALYVDAALSVGEIAIRIGCRPRVVYDALTRCAIPKRNRHHPRLDDAAWLTEQFLDNRRTAQNIAIELACSEPTVVRALRLQGVRRPHRRELRSREWCVRQYLDLQRSTHEIATELGVGHATVLAWIRRHDIPVRERLQAAALSPRGPAIDRTPQCADCKRPSDQDRCERCRERQRRVQIERELTSRAEPAQPPDPRPARELRKRLAKARRAAGTFDDAWQSALEQVLSEIPEGRAGGCCERGQWATAFSSTEPAWRRGWYRTGEQPLAKLFDPAPDDGERGRVDVLG